MIETRDSTTLQPRPNLFNHDAHPSTSPTNRLMSSACTPSVSSPTSLHLRELHGLRHHPTLPPPPPLHRRLYLSLIILSVITDLVLPISQLLFTCVLLIKSPSVSSPSPYSAHHSSCRRLYSFSILRSRSSDYSTTSTDHYTRPHHYDYPTSHPRPPLHLDSQLLDATDFRVSTSSPSSYFESSSPSSL